MVQGRSPNNPLQRSDHDKVHAPDCCADGGFSGYAKLVFRAFIAAGVLVASQPGWAQVADSTPMQPKALEELAEVVITGEQAGPALWKVTKDGHALWIMATLSPLPKDITWRSRQVERVIGDSQEVYGDLFISLTTKGNDREEQRILRDAQLNVGGKTLKDVLPAAMYARFVALNRKYGGDKNVEKLRPFYAMQELSQKAMRNMGLTLDDGAVRGTIRRLAKKRGATFRPISREYSYSKDQLRELKALSSEEEIACADAWMNRFESELELTKARANAWSTGDVAALRADTGLYQPRQSAECLNVFLSTQRMRQAMVEGVQLRHDTLRAALQNNKSTLAMVHIGELLDPKGLLAQFRAEGFEIEEP
jgi:uncharacterized protein YbaP (TraB family)